ncbi:MAG: ABC transporter substrate-binding protein [Massilibacteroides sp.]|nr:ABC transporter substrate-binding protein [Massilibacteroides sp.]MDD4115598.1 ABC transporter substrate-binding protein [Massilibacteroides sp.]
MKTSSILFPCVLLSLLLCCCNQANKVRNKEPASKEIFNGRTRIKYAKGFSVKEYANYKLVDVTDPSGENESVYKYALLKRGTDRSNIPFGYEIIETPIQKAICMTTLQISNFIKLNVTDRIIGITSTRFLFDKKLNKQLNEKKTHRIGIEGEFDTELILAINPDIILVSPFKRGGYETLRNLDIPLISFLGYKESSPLGQAEWIKFIAMLLNLEEQAEMQFDEIEKKYQELATLAKATKKKPTVLSGELHSGNWYVVGGNSYLAQLFRDAGATYFMSNDNESGGFYVDFETVYSQSANADYWRMVNSYQGKFSYEALKQSDSRYADFKAFQEKKLIYCNLREKPFYENTPVEPEVVLADLIKIFHPTLLPEHVPVYYELLK